MNQRITLIQTVTSTEDFHELLAIGELPLVISLSKTDKRLYMNKDGKLKTLSIASLYISKDWWKNHNNQTYAFIKNGKLKELIETKKIYIPEFIDLNGVHKYVDYIKADATYDLKYGHKIIFRDKKRLFERNQASYSIKRNRERDFNTNGNYEDGEMIDILCIQAIKQYEERIKRMEDTKEKLKKLEYKRDYHEAK